MATPPRDHSSEGDFSAATYPSIAVSCHVRRAGESIYFAIREETHSYSMAFPFQSGGVDLFGDTFGQWLKSLGFFDTLCGQAE